MIDKICLFLTNKIRTEMPEIDDERAEVINYGLQILVGEIPKVFIMLVIAYVLGVFKLTLIAFLLIMPYRATSGGIHMHSHIGCIILTCFMYAGPAILSKYIVFTEMAKYMVIIAVWIFSMLMIKLYAPADTEDVPILENKVRRKKQIASYLLVTIGLILAMFIKDNLLSNILIFGNLIQTILITKLAYRLANNKYGYEVYKDTSEELV